MNYLTTKEVCALLKVHDNTLYKMRKAGKIQFTKLSAHRIRYPEDGVDDYLAGKGVANDIQDNKS